MPSETTSLLPTTEAERRHDNPGFFNGESAEVAEMKKVTHNDPSLARDTENMKKLRGSTLMLYNNVVADEMSQSSRRESMDGGDLQRISRLKKARSSSISLIYNKQRDHAMLYLEKVKTNFFQDAKSLAEGTIPQSIVLALAIGIVCGIAFSLDDTS
ncbi:MAG: hypothetical protein SGARI_003955 [Bacillariaceae sp.]